MHVAKSNNRWRLEMWSIIEIKVRRTPATAFDSWWTLSKRMTQKRWRAAAEAVFTNLVSHSFLWSPKNLHTYWTFTKPPSLNPAGNVWHHPAVPLSESLSFTIMPSLHLSDHLPAHMSLFPLPSYIFYPKRFQHRFFMWAWTSRWDLCRLIITELTFLIWNVFSC